MPGHELLLTRRLVAQFVGPANLGIEEQLAARAAARHFGNGRSDPAVEPQVEIQPFAAPDCGRSPTVEIEIRFGPADLAQMQAEASRGPAEQVTARRLAAAAKVTDDGRGPAPAIRPDGTRRHDWFRLYYATTRERTGAAASAKAFGARPGDGVVVGHVQVSIPADHRWARLENPSIFRFEWDSRPDRHLVLDATLAEMRRDDWQRELSARAGRLGKPGVLLFVHGYNTNFEQAALRAAQLAHDLAFAGPVVMFSWPSDGDALAYLRDAEETRTAWRQMSSVLETLTQLGSGVPVHVIAHSMGSRVLVGGLAHLVQRKPSAERQFRHVVLAAPDIGTREFRALWLNELRGANPPRYTLYASEVDSPIALSTWLHGEPRLGKGGQSLFVAEGLDSIDASAVAREWFGLGHSYFGDNDTILSDLFLLINRGLPPADRPRLRRAEREGVPFWRFQP